MTRTELIELIEFKLNRRRALNDPEAMSHRRVIGPVTSISLTFAVAEAVLAHLRRDEGVALDEIH